MASRTSVMIVDDFEPWRSFVSATLLKEPNLQIVGEVADAVKAIGEAEYNPT